MSAVSVCVFGQCTEICILVWQTFRLVCCNKVYLCRAAELWDEMLPLHIHARDKCSMHQNSIYYHLVIHSELNNISPVFSLLPARDQTCTLPGLQSDSPRRHWCHSKERRPPSAESSIKIAPPFLLPQLRRSNAHAPLAQCQTVVCHAAVVCVQGLRE